MDRQRATPAVYAKLVACMALWGATWVSGRVVAQQMTPFAAAFLRFLFASAFLYVLLCRASAQSGQTGWPRLTRERLPGVAFLALTGVALYNALFFSGLARISASRAALMVACVPSAVALYNGLVLRRPTGAAKALGIALSLLGVAVILSGGDVLSLVTQGADAGDLFILGCVVTWAAYTIGGGRVMAMTTDPVFIVPEYGFERAAWFAIHILCSDAVTSALAPTYLSIDLNLPLEMTKGQFESVWKVIDAECKKMGLAVVCGHTGRYDGCHYPMVGGAPVTQEWANEIGADGYAKDAFAAIAVAKDLLS